MLRSPSLLNRQSGLRLTQPNGNKRFPFSAPRRIVRLVLLVFFIGVLVYIHSISNFHFRIKLSIPTSSKELKARLANPNIRNRIHFHPTEKGASAAASEKKYSKEKVDDSWDWDEADGDYDKKFAAVVEDESS